MNRKRRGAHLRRRAIVSVRRSWFPPPQANNRMTDLSLCSSRDGGAAMPSANAFTELRQMRDTLPSRASAHLAKGTQTTDKNPGAQLYLTIGETWPMALPEDKQRELAAAFAGLFWNLAVAAAPDEPTTTETGKSHSLPTAAHLSRPAILCIGEPSPAPRTNGRMTNLSVYVRLAEKAKTLSASPFDRSAGRSAVCISRTPGHLEKMLVEVRMTRKKDPDAQMNLLLCETPPLALPQDKQRQLAAALADLLWNAAVAAEPDQRTSTETAGDHS